MEHWISFPGLGIDAFRLDAVAFTLFGRDVRWYGIIITLGIIAAFSYTAWRAGQYGIAFDDMLDTTLIVVPGGVIGARLYFIAFEYFGESRHYDSFLDAIAFWDGGLAIYGGIIAGGLLTLLVMCVKRIRPLRFMDALAPGVMLGQLIGRWGNFTNGEAHGGETSLFCRMGLSYSEEITHFYHPTFLYESLWNLLGFLLINLFYKKKKFDGQWLLAYLGWYGLGRGFIELLRTDSLCIPNTAIRISSLVGFITFGLSLLLTAILLPLRPACLSLAKPTYGERKKRRGAQQEEKKVLVIPTKSKAQAAADTDDKTEKIPLSGDISPDISPDASDDAAPGKPDAGGDPPGSTGPDGKKNKQDP